MTAPLTLREVLAGKRDGVVVVEAKTPLRRAVQLMNEARTGAVLVTDGGRLVGIVTERDVLRRIAGRDSADLTMPLAAVMTSPVHCAPASMCADDAMQSMSEARHRHLAVVEAGSPVGVISIGDLMNLATRELERWVIDLSRFISGPAATVDLPSLALGRRVLPGPD